MFPFKAKMAPMKATITEETDFGSFFAVVLGTLLVAFVLPNLASRLSRMLTPKKKKQEEAMSTYDMVEMHMAEREMYRYNKNATTPNVFEPYEQDDSDDEHDWDDEITVQSFLEVRKAPKSRKEEVEEEEEVLEGKKGTEKEEKEEEKEEEITSGASNWRCACESGFLPPGLLKSFGGAEAVIRMSTGQCYHKQ
jgi:uncharacterized membrane protein YhiD involved in acid resistance